MKFRNFLIICFFFLFFIFIVPCFGNFCKGFLFECDLGGNHISVDYGDIELRKNTFISVTDITYSYFVSFYSSDYDFFAVNGSDCYYGCLNSGEDYIRSSVSLSKDSNEIAVAPSPSVETAPSNNYKIITIRNSKKYEGLWYGYSDFDIKNKNGEIVFKKNNVPLLEIDYSPQQDTVNVPINVHTGWYSVEDFADCKVQYSYDNKKWIDCEWGITYFEDLGKNMYQYYIDVYNNDTYYFRQLYIPDMEYQYVSVEINNIIYTQDNAGNYVDGVFDPTPFLGYEYISNSEIYITTQKFFIYELIDLQCYYAKDIEDGDFNNPDKWTKVDTRVFQDQISGEDVYQFYFSVKNDTFDGNGTYYVKFYNVFLDKWTYSSIVVDFDSILSVNGSVLFKYLTFFRQRFGFLIYPFDLAGEVLNKFRKIEFAEPSFNIPDINEPFTGKRLVSAVQFNFNDTLDNPVFKNIHDIYLVVVDVIIIFALVNLLKNKIMGVFEK